MYSLFTSEPTKAGYRLKYMEIFNWGTFDGEIYRISPEGNNSLLTGGNGSGKTTYVDALLTLLVPVKKYRFYNRSSGTDKKSERTEESYVMGAYGEQQEEGKLHSKTIFLRPDKKKVYSLLLACFSNADGSPITLYQARWFFNNEMKRAYGIAYHELTIKQDFTPFDSRGDWKKSLKNRYPARAYKESIEFYDSAKIYAERLVKYFGMRSEKALSLFNQTVGIKVLGNLDEFIRIHMLEQQDAETKFIQLKDNYNTLLHAQNQIEKAGQQLKQLTPIKESAGRLQQREDQLKEILHFMKIRPFYFADRAYGFLTGAIETETRHVEIITRQMADLRLQKEELEETREKLNVAIQTDETGRRLKEIHQEIARKEKLKQEREKRSGEYDKIAHKIGIPTTPGEKLFYENREKAAGRKNQVQDEQTQWKEKQFQNRRELEDNKAEFTRVEQEVDELRSQKNKITGRTAELRREVAARVGATVDEFPFVGELVKVKETQKEWEPALERLLHAFAQEVIIPEVYNDRVDRYVEAADLKGQIVYHRVKETSYLNTMVKRHPDSVIEKLEIKPTVYEGWLENRLLTVYDYVCVDGVGEFHRYQKALTRQGLAKNENRHRKDDRPEVVSRENYVLGWDNKEKIKVLVEKAKGLDRAIKEGEKQKQALEQRLKKLDDENDNIVRLLSYTEFTEMDWQTAAKAIETLKEEKNKLEAASDKIKQLQQELDRVKGEIKRKEEENDRHLRDKTRKEDYLDRCQLRLEESSARMADPFIKEIETAGGFDSFVARYREHLGGLDLENIDNRQKAVEQEQTGLQVKWRAEQAEEIGRLQRSMIKFKNPDKEIIDQYPDWQADTHELPEDPRFVDEYITLLERIERDDLPTYQKKFEDYLSSTMINRIAEFKEYLDEGEEAIEENIAALNRSLRKISFNTSPATYIQLRCPTQQDVEIREFKQMLKEAIPDVAQLHLQDNTQYKRYIFKQIQKLIDRLEKNPEWRWKVIDVRDWKFYYAEEYYQENEASMKVYRDMGKLSGGEKAQLTYTILGSAIAYQFGIKHTGLETDSFRFITVDETFSNQDDEKATYLMDLCRQLHLQLLVVTPSDKIHIVEPYISYVHYVQRKNNRESLLFDMPIKQFREQRERYQENREPGNEEKGKESAKGNEPNEEKGNES